MGIDTAEGHLRSGLAHGEGVKVQVAVAVNRSPEELYAFWRNFENLPRVTQHLMRVVTTAEGRSRWVTLASLLGSDLKKKLEHNIRQFKSGSRCFQ